MDRFASSAISRSYVGAGDGARTHDIQLGKLERLRRMGMDLRRQTGTPHDISGHERSGDDTGKSGNLGRRG